jgi:D-alanyl-D-alanine carboxypeptidase (penicillin-binding protein 5/6)
MSSQPFALPGIHMLRVSSPINLSISPTNLTASGVLLLDGETGERFYEYNAKVARPTGSLAKIMTALIILEHHPLNQVVTVPPIVDDMQGSALGLKPGQTFTVESLLKAMLIPSANDAAYSLAVHHSGTVQAFVEEMNGRAKALGLKDTHFQNPAGFDGAGQHASPQDLAWLSMSALRKSVFRTIVNTPSTTIQSLEGKDYGLLNTNELLRSFPNVEGVKTGTTGDAGQCLITLFRENNRPFLLVIMGSRDRYRDARAIMGQVGKHLAKL